MHPRDDRPDATGPPGRPEARRRRPDPAALDRIDSTLRAISRPGFFDARRHLWRRHRGGSAGVVRRSAFDHLWPYANAWSAVCAAAATPGLAVEPAELLTGFPEGAHSYGGPGPAARGYRSSVLRPPGTRGDRYYDDNAWLGLAMVRHADVTGDARILESARAVLSFVMSGWSDAGGVEPGGVRWRDTPRSRTRHVCSTAPAVQLALELFRRSGETALFEWALAAYEWTRRALGDDEGLYFDRISPDGRVVHARWTYNQGTMIGAGTELAAATGDPRYLGHALESADAALARFGLDRLVRQGPPFAAIYFRNLFFLSSRLTPQLASRPGGELAGAGRAARELAGAAARITEAAAAYGDAMWERARDARTGLFRAGRSTLNATAPMIEVYALLAGAPGRP